jgi:hypothetical protein
MMNTRDRLHEAWAQLDSIDGWFRTDFTAAVEDNVLETIDTVLSAIDDANEALGESDEAPPWAKVEEKLRRLRGDIDTDWDAANLLEMTLQEIKEVTDSFQDVIDGLEDQEEAVRS